MPNVKSIEKQPILGLMSFLMKHIYAKDLHPFKEKIMALFAKVEKGPEKDYIEIAIAYLFAAGNMSDSDEFAIELANHLDD